MITTAIKLLVQFGLMALMLKGLLETIKAASFKTAACGQIQTQSGAR